MIQQTKYFGTDGIRGKVGQLPITEDFFYVFGQAIGRFFNESNNKKLTKIIVGSDPRQSSPVLTSALTKGLNSSGVEITLAGIIPTPAIAHLTTKLKYQAGIIISASHNLYHDNGIKIFNEKGIKLTLEDEATIEKLTDSCQKNKSNIVKLNIINLENAQNQYIDFCTKLFPDLNLSGIHIALDNANGANSNIANNILENLGAKVSLLNSNPDGININHNCGANSLTGLVNLVSKLKCDIGIAFDGDGDRVAICDSNGKIYDGDDILYLIVKNKIKKNQEIGGIVGTIMTNYALEKYLNNMGLLLFRAEVGDRNIVYQMLEKKLKVGGEPSGHTVLLDHHTTGDGLVTALKILDILLNEQTTLDKALNPFKKYIQINDNILLNNKNYFLNKKQKIEKEISYWRKELGKDYRIIFRLSGTEPIIRLTVEGPEEHKALIASQEISLLISNTIQDHK